LSGIRWAISCEKQIPFFTPASKLAGDPGAGMTTRKVAAKAKGCAVRSLVCLTFYSYYSGLTVINL
jgi:hypothetical protein